MTITGTTGPGDIIIRIIRENVTPAIGRQTAQARMRREAEEDWGR
jgi:hypothetical protein